MLIKLFNGKNTTKQLFIIVAYGLLISLVPVSIAPNYGFNPLYVSFYHLVANHPWAIKLSFFLALVLPILLTQFYSQERGLLIRKHYHFLFLSLLLLFSNFNAWTLNPVILSLLFVVIGTQKLFQLEQSDRASEKLAFGAMLFSFASLIYSVLAWDVILVISALFIFRQVKVREIVLVLTSFLIPYIYLFSIFFLQGRFMEKIDEMQRIFAHYFLPINWGVPWYQMVFNGLLLFLTVAAIVRLITKNKSKLIQVREYTNFIVLSLGFTIILLLVAGANTAYHYQLILFYIALVVSIYFSDLKTNWYFESIILLILIHNVYIIFLQLYA